MTRQHKLVRWVLISAVTSMGSAGCIADGGEEPDGPVGVAGQQVQGGTPDDSSTPLFPEVVFLLVDPGNTNGKCSGTLISPWTILTARHCFIGVGYNATVQVTFGFDPNNPLPFTRNHTQTTSGKVLALNPNPNPDILSKADQSQDVAIFFLDTPVGGDLVKPRHASLAPVVGKSEFQGTLVGYGPRFEDDLDPKGVCGGGDTARVRRYKTGSWGGQDVLDRRLYFNSWVIGYPVPPGIFIYDPCKYEGPTGGDSGGPLLDEQGNIRAVMGSIHPTVLPLTLIENSWNGGADSSAAINMFKNAKATMTQGPFSGPVGAIDPHGNWLGECPDYLHACDNWQNCLDIDQDGDKVMDRCDSCPTIYNPEQLWQNDDTDGNGWGDACDFCPGVKYSGGGYNVGFGSSCNYEIELAETYPNQGEAFPPAHTLGQPSADPTSLLLFALNKSRYRGAFRPDACDPVACPRQSLIGSGDLDGLLPGIHICTQQSVDPQCNCIWSVKPECSWFVSSNTIRMWPAIHDAATSLPKALDPLKEGLPVGASVEVGMRFCTCGDGADTETLAQRVDCQKKCPYGAGSYAHPKWAPLATEPASKWPNGSDHGKTFSAKVSSLAKPDPNNAVSARWDFTDLPAAMVTRTKLTPTSTSINTFETFGILMSKVVGVKGTTVSPVWYPSYFARAQTFQSGNAIASAGSPKVIKLPDQMNPPWFFEDPFQGAGPDPYRLIGKAPGDDRLWALTISGIEEVPHPPASVVATIDSFLTGTQRFVTASEMPAVLARRTLVGAPLLRGVAVDPVHAEIGQVIESVDPFTLPIVSGRAPCVGHCSPEIHGNEAVVLSGALRRLLVLGGTSDGTPSAAPNTSAWLLDVDKNEWTELPLPAGARPGHVRSGVYRADDGQVYFVETKAGKDRLSRFLPHGGMAELALLPAEWAQYPIQHLVVGEGGDLVLAASNAPSGVEESVLLCHHSSGKGDKEHTLTVAAAAVAAHLAKGDTLGPCLSDSLGDDPGAKMSLLARFTVSSDGKLSFVGAKRLSSAILGRPIVTGDVILAPVPKETHARLRHVGLDELVTVPPGQAPFIE
jgi:hypothetical protein